MRPVVLLCVLTAAGCSGRAQPRVMLAPDTTRVELVQRRMTGALTPAERDSLLRDLTARRDAWRAHHITAYRIQIAVGCFCPWPGNPAILEVRNGAAVALYDTSGRSIGAPREPWSLYTVDGLFAGAEQSARRNDVFEVAYDPHYGYPAIMRGDLKIGLPDDWFWVRASRLTPLK